MAEDQPINQRVIGDMLRLLGVQVTLASDGREALARLVEAPFDAVLMDIQMPEMDGLTATARIRDNPAWVDLPVIALTAGITEAERERMTACGMTDLLPKPVTLDALTVTLRRWLGTSGAVAESAMLVPPPPCGTDPGEALSLPGFDLHELLRTMRDPTKVSALLREFADSVRDEADIIAQALARGETATAAHYLHQLKGISGYLGATALSAATVRLETDLQAGHDLTLALNTLRQAHAQAIVQIASLPPPTVAEAVII